MKWITTVFERIAAGFVAGYLLVKKALTTDQKK